MLPPRAYAEPLPPFSANLRAQPSPSDSRPSLIVAVAPQDVDRFPATPYARFAARTTAEAVRLIERWRPRVVVVDWDVAELDASAICNTAKQMAPVGVLAVMSEPAKAPSALKAGCHALLLKPLAGPVKRRVGQCD